MAKPCSWAHGGTGLCSLHPSSVPTVPPVLRMSPQMNFLQSWDLVGATRPEAGAAGEEAEGSWR